MYGVQSDLYQVVIRTNARSLLLTIYVGLAIVTTTTHM